MGGYGSGSHHRYHRRDTVESYLRLDVRRLHRDGQLEPRRRSGTHWRWAGGRAAGSISHRAVGHGGRAKALVLEYRYKAPSGTTETVEQTVWLEWTPCNYGSARPWFLCPRCDRRVAILYGGLRFYCRHCHDLAYASSRESAADRGTRKAQNIRQRLGGSTNLMQPFPPKPKGMHWRTYDRLEAEAEAAHRVALVGLLAKLETVAHRLGRQ